MACHTSRDSEEVGGDISSLGGGRNWETLKIRGPPVRGKRPKKTTAATKKSRSDWETKLSCFIRPQLGIFFKKLPTNFPSALGEKRKRGER